MEEELIRRLSNRSKSLDPKASDALPYTESQSLVDSAKQKLRLWDVADDDVEDIAQADESCPRRFHSASPADGDCYQKKWWLQGSAVQTGMKVMRIE